MILTFRGCGQNEGSEEKPGRNGGFTFLYWAVYFLFILLASDQESQETTTSCGKSRLGKNRRQSGKAVTLIDLLSASNKNVHVLLRALQLIAMKNSLQQSGISDFGPFFDQEELDDLGLDFYS